MKYHIAILRIIFLGLLFLFPTVIIPVSAEVASPTDLEIEIHKRVNKVRESDGTNLIELRLHSLLIEIARAHSEDMLKNGYFDHINLQNDGPSDRVSNSGITWSYVAENLYTSDGYLESEIAPQSVNGWVNSPGHYKNMLSPTSFTGIGVAKSDGLYFVTQVFIDASVNHMEEMGVIYDNENIEDRGVVEESKINTTYIVVGIVIAVIIFGKYAEGMNRGIYRRRK